MQQRPGDTDYLGLPRSSIAFEGCRAPLCRVCTHPPPSLTAPLRRCTQRVVLCVLCVLCVSSVCVNLCQVVCCGLQNLETQHRVLVSFCGLFLLGPPRLRDRYGSVVTTEGFNGKTHHHGKLQKGVAAVAGFGQIPLTSLDRFLLTSLLA